MDLRGGTPASQETAETARRSEPGGSRTFPRMRCLSKTARNPDRLLRCRLACIGSCSAECRAIDSKRMVIRIEQGKGQKCYQQHNCPYVLAKIMLPWSRNLLLSGHFPNIDST